MTVKELKEKLAQFNDDMEVKVFDEYGYWDDCNSITLITTEDYDISKNCIILENRNY